jgi:MFS family permease
MSDADIGHVLGLLFSLFFVAGLPLIPLWGVWADKYSRKAVVIRSALVERWFSWRSPRAERHGSWRSAWFW